jgi:hypothetical protein
MKLQDSDREHAIQLLSAHYAQGALSTRELEARFERVYAARDTDGLRALFDGLPQLPQTIEPPRGMYAVAPTGTMQHEKRILCVMSEAKRRGEWIPAHRNVVKVFMGKVTIDLREALLVPGAVTEFDCFALWGEVLFIVPPGVAVECEGMPVMGTFDDASSRTSVAPDAPRIHITGTALMAGVKVRTRLPGESALAAWRRQFNDRSR